jgi:methyl-accepting chemotaxis protein/methyl-accepting chemotaxis protein-1 (serine sensor receptor)
VKTLVDEVHVGSQEQSRGLDQISKAISQMEQVTQKTAATAEESAAAGEELSAQSHTLHHLIGELTTFVGGYGSEGDPALASEASASKALVSKNKVQPPRTAFVKTLAPPARPAFKLQAENPVPVTTGRKPDNQEFPMEDDFREF